jgi:hemolysin III
MGDRACIVRGPMTRDVEAASDVDLRPRLRGVFHQYAFILAVVAGVLLVAAANTGRAQLAVGIYGVSLVAMFGSSALYHRSAWTPAQRRRLRRLDHSMIYALIAGTYTPFGLLALSGGWRVGVLTVVWTGALAAIVLTVIWTDGPTWVAPVIAVTLGWVGIVALPQLVDAVGVVAVVLVFAGGILYTSGSLVYARRRPDPVPAVFGYHELFHTLVIAAAACQYASIALLL